ncbi:MAG TPA: hypothetical protein VM934_10620 [Pyrinomonadaceae bacterium]|jgi:hypothetical protein|nr:hypothetical protein [Pyrinomonadaceae bacterium]
MIMKIAVLFLVASFVFASPSRFVAAQRAASKSGYTVRVRGKGLVLVSQGRSHALDVADKVDAARIEDVTLLFADRRGASLYLLLSVCGSSKLRPDDRQCGAGVECNLVWVKLGDDWKVKDSRSVRYESCWMPITSDEGYKISGRLLHLEYSDLRENLHYKVSYDSDNPEKGLSVEESRLPETGFAPVNRTSERNQT